MALPGVQRRCKRLQPCLWFVNAFCTQEAFGRRLIYGRWAVTPGANITNEFMNRRRWIAVVVFWILFVASIGLDPYYPWLRVAWTVLGIGLLVVGSIYSVVETSRRGYRTGEFSYYRGVPRFLWSIVLDDEEYEKRTSKSKQMPGPDSKG